MKLYFVFFITTVLTLTSENGFWGYCIGSLSGVWETNIFLTMFSAKIVIKCAATVLKISLHIKDLCATIFLIQIFL